MLIAGLLENNTEEKRLSILPETVEKYCQLGYDVGIASGLGKSLNILDKAFEEKGARIFSQDALISKADVVLRVGKPSLRDLDHFKPGCLSVSFLDPFFERKLVEHAAQKNISLMSMELIPRLTYAQKMDALSSQANLSGYVAVILAASQLNKAFPMMMTAAGTISPARVFVIGAGVAGLQAIATAKRLGARVEAFDTRPEVEEQINSLGARFIKVDLGETEKTKEGYAKALTAEQLAKQQEAMAKVCAYSDVVITTAQVFGRRAPVIVKQSMLDRMKPGSVVVDLAAGTGGNVEGTQINEIRDFQGIKIIGYTHLPGFVAQHATEMYANNLYHLMDTVMHKTEAEYQLDLEHEITKGCLVTFQSKVVHPVILKAYESGKE